MKKYKVQITETKEYCVDVEANDQDTAQELAYAKWYKEIVPQGTEHYHQTGDTDEQFDVFDVTNTDDPFNP